jgi:hypothetical protein
MLMACCVVCFCSLRSIAAGSVVLATFPLAGFVARRRRRFAVRPCVAGALVVPAAVKNCKKTIRYDGDSLVSEAHLCRRLVMRGAPVSTKRPAVEGLCARRHTWRGLERRGVDTGGALVSRLWFLVGLFKMGCLLHRGRNTRFERREGGRHCR